MYRLALNSALRQALEQVLLQVLELLPLRPVPVLLLVPELLPLRPVLLRVLLPVLLLVLLLLPEPGPVSVSAYSLVQQGQLYILSLLSLSLPNSEA